MRVVAGNGQKGVPPDGAVALEAPLSDPRAVAHVDSRVENGPISDHAVAGNAGIAGIRIDDGHFDSEDLSGIKVGLMMDLPGIIRRGLNDRCAGVAPLTDRWINRDLP